MASGVRIRRCAHPLRVVALIYLCGALLFRNVAVARMG